MPRDGLTQHEEQWTEQVLQALQLEPAPESPDEASHSPRDTYLAEWRKLQKRLENLIETSQTMVDKCDVLTRNEEKTEFWKHGKRAFSLLQSTQFAISKASDDDRLDLDVLNGQLDVVQSHFDQMQLVCQGSTSQADQVISKVLSGQIEPFRQIVSQARLRRNELEDWGLNLMRLEQRLDIATDLLNQISAAVSSHRVRLVEELLGQTQHASKALNAALSEAEQRQKRMSQDTLQSLQESEAETAALKTQSAALRQAPELQLAFVSASEQFYTSLMSAQTALHKGRYQNALLHYNQMIAAVFTMRQQLLLSQVQNKRRALTKKSQSAVLAAQAQDLRSQLDQALKNLSIVRTSSPFARQYEQACQTTGRQLTKALSSLTAHKKSEAAQSIRDAESTLMQLTQWHAGALDNISAAADQLEQLKAQIAPWLTPPSDAVPDQLILHGEQVQQANDRMKQASAHLQQNNANPAREAISKAYQNLKVLMELTQSGSAAVQSQASSFIESENEGNRFDANEVSDTKARSDT